MFAPTRKDCLYIHCKQKFSYASPTKHTYFSLASEKKSPPKGGENFKVILRILRVSFHE